MSGAACPPSDLRPGDDRRREPGDGVRLRVAVELEQVRLERVERVEATPAANGAASMTQRTGGFPSPWPSDALKTSCVARSGR